MTSLNNQELRKKIIETLHPERNGLLIKGGIAEGANHEGLIVDNLEKLFESELANRERVAESRIAKSLHDRIFNNFDMLPRIQTAYTGDRNIDVRKLQKVICEFRDNLQNLPVYGD